MNIADFKFDLSRTGLKLQKYSPEILLGLGLIGFLGTIILASKAALEVAEIVEETKDELATIDEQFDDPDNDKYDTTDYRKDMAVVYVNSGLKFAKLYGPTVAVGVASTACILASRGIMAHRNAVLVSLYNITAEGYKAYRKRVVDEFGEEKDKMFHLGYEEKISNETVIDEEGKKIKSKVRLLEATNEFRPSIYAKFFDESSTEWCSTRNLNNFFLMTQQTWCTDNLRSKGHMFLNEVHDRLGIPRTLEGQLVGWVYKKNNPIGDNYVDFGLFNVDNPGARDFVNGYNPAVLLDFNVQGIIADLI